MRQNRESEINRIISKLEKALENMNQQPLGKNEFITVDRSALPQQIKIIFRKEASLAIDIIIEEKRETIIQYNNGLYEYRLKNKNLLDKKSLFPFEFEQQLSCLLYPYKIVPTAEIRKVKINSEPGTSTGIIKIPLTPDSKEISFLPFFDLPEKERDSFLIKTKLSYPEDALSGKVAQMKKSERIYLLKEDIENYYKTGWASVLFFSTFALTLIKEWPFFIIGIPVLSVILFGYYRKKLLKFRKYSITCTEEQFKQAFINTALELEWWYIYNYYTDYIHVMRTNTKDHIHILRKENEILIQSISYSFIQSEQNQENTDTFIKNLRTITHASSLS